MLTFFLFLAPSWTAGCVLDSSVGQDKGTGGKGYDD
jgi:hypothetical protein